MVQVAWTPILSCNVCRFTFIKQFLWWCRILLLSLYRYVDDVISRIGRMFPDMTIELFRPNGTSAVLLVITHTTNHTLQGCWHRDTGTGVCLSHTGDPGEGLEGNCCYAFAIHRQNSCSRIQWKCLQRRWKGEQSESSDRWRPIPVSIRLTVAFVCVFSWISGPSPSTRSFRRWDSRFTYSHTPGLIV